MPLVVPGVLVPEPRPAGGQQRLEDAAPGDHHVAPVEVLGRVEGVSASGPGGEGPQLALRLPDEDEAELGQGVHDSEIAGLERLGVGVVEYQLQSWFGTGKAGGGRVIQIPNKALIWIRYRIGTKAGP